MLAVFGLSVLALLVALVRLVGARNDEALARRAHRWWVHPDTRRLTSDGAAMVRVVWLAVVVLAAVTAGLTWPQPGPIAQAELAEELSPSALDRLEGMESDTARRRIVGLTDGSRWTLHRVGSEDPGFVSDTQELERWQALGTDGRAATCVSLVTLRETGTVDYVSASTGFC